MSERQAVPIVARCMHGRRCKHPDGPLLELSEFVTDSRTGRRAECTTCFKARMSNKPRKGRIKAKPVREGKLWQAAPKGADGKPLPYWKWTTEDSRNYDAAREENKQ